MSRGSAWAPMQAVAVGVATAEAIAALSRGSTPMGMHPATEAQSEGSGSVHDEVVLAQQMMGVASGWAPAMSPTPSAMSERWVPGWVGWGGVGCVCVWGGGGIGALWACVRVLACVCYEVPTRLRGHANACPRTHGDQPTVGCGPPTPQDVLRQRRQQPHAAFTSAPAPDGRVALVAQLVPPSPARDARRGRARHASITPQAHG